MTRICPKCRYVRQPSDEAPDWQCPSCQVAYAKAAGPAPAPIRRSAPSSAGAHSWPRIGWVLVLAGVAIVAWRGEWAWKHAAGLKPAVAAVPGEQPAVTLYSAEWCGYCTATRKFFVANDIAFVEYDVEKTTAGYEGHRALGGGGIPVVKIDDEVIRGYNEQVLRATFRSWLPER